MNLPPAPGKFRISLEEVKFYSRIGVFEQEREVGNEFSVSLSVIIPNENFVSECLDTSISYADLYEIAKDVMSREWLLLESVADCLCRMVLRQCSAVESVYVSITKLTPPIKGMQGGASVALTLSR